MINFDNVMDRSGMSTMKWEAEIDRIGNPEILCFGTADMDFYPPDPVLDAIHKIVEIGHLGYPYITNDYYASIDKWLKRFTGWEIDAVRCVSTNVGIYTSAWTIIDSLTKPGDEIIIQTPVHYPFNSIVADNGRVTVMNPLRLEEDRYVMDYEDLEQRFSEKTKLLWLCNPHNPVGRAWMPEELQRLAEICLKHNVFIMSDDVYAGLVYPGYRYTPVASLSKEISKNTITCYSVSKTYNVTGVKHSFIVTENSDLLRKYNESLKKIDLTYGMNIIGIAVTKAALNECDNWVKELMKYIKGNYDLVKDFVKNKMPLVEVIQAESTYFAWLNFRKLELSPERMDLFFETEAKVIVNNGNVLGKGGTGFIRLNMACSRKVLKMGLERILEAYGRL